MVPDNERKVLQKLRKTIKAAAPQTEELISYPIPTYKYHGPLVHFAAFKNHLSFFGVDKSLLEKFMGELEDYDVKGTTIHFSAEKPLPEDLITKIVKLRVKDNESRKR